MNTYQSTPDFYRDYIQHFNKNHDPKNGQFVSGHGGNTSVNSKVKKARRTGKYDMEFLEKGLDQDQRTGQLLKGKALDDAYNKYLNEKEKTKSNDFSSTEKKQLNDKELKKWYKNAKETPTNKMFAYEDEFDESKKGKQLKKKYQDAWDLDWDDPSTEKNFDKAENDYLRERQKYAVTKFLKDDAKNYTLQQIAYDVYPMYGKPKSVSEQDVKNYLLNEQWKLHKA